MTIAFEQSLQRPQVVRQAADDLIFFQTIRHRNLNRAVERKLPSIDLLQSLVSFDQHVVIFQQLGPETPTSFFDAFGKFDFLPPRQQRDFAHLRQIHPHRVIGPGFTFVDRQQFVGTIQLHFTIDGDGRDGRRGIVIVAIDR